MHGDFSDQFDFDLGFWLKFVVTGLEESLPAVCGFSFDDDEFGARVCLFTSWMLRFAFRCAWSVLLVGSYHTRFGFWWDFRLSCWILR